MITINLKGGLGNQMFQYAAARCLSDRYMAELNLNLEYFENIPKGDVPRKYQLDIFQIKNGITFTNTINPAQKLLQKIILKIFGEKIQIYTANILLKVGIPAYLNGYFQSESYFSAIREKLLKEFTVTKKLDTEAKKIEEFIATHETVAINIRRGDYTRPDYAKTFGTMNMIYYNKAINTIKSRIPNPFFCIFSDDPDWVKKEFQLENTVFAGTDILKDYEQMYLMSICKHNIIANSSFAWWGAWLNQNSSKIIIAPRNWMTKKTSDELGILPNSWIQI